MKKKIILFFICLFMFFSATAQKHNSVNIDNSIYMLFDNLQIRGLIDTLPLTKPYSEEQIIDCINDLLSSEEKLKKITDAEKEILVESLTQFERKPGFDIRRFSFNAATTQSKRKTTMNIGASVGMESSVGLYSGVSENKNRFYWDLMPEVHFDGTFWDAFSVKFDIFGFMGYAPLEKMPGNYLYDIGGWWTGAPSGINPTSRRFITSWNNFTTYPYAFKKKWDGSVYYLSKPDTAGLAAWPFETSVGFGIFSEVSSSFFDKNLLLRAGRMYREWAGMDTGASLVLNASARPFLGLELTATPIKWFSFSSMFGSLEMPHSEHITEHEVPGQKDPVGAYHETGAETAKLFQNLFAINMMEFNFKYVHFDFGTTVITRKHFEIGYLFPLMSKLVFQNSIGDFDNISLFADLKFRWPGIFEIWTSAYIDEIAPFNEGEGFKSGNFFKRNRQMYAYQVGGKASIPLLPFANVSLRYTKIEPFCYTHQIINNTPWTSEYMSESYMNNGASLGYYLPPNSDELLIRMEASPVANLIAHLQYQMVRHGAESGSRQVRGSSIYSELDPQRYTTNKFFLRDGAYQWSHVIKVGAEYNMKKVIGVPLTLYGDIGYVYTYYTDSDTGTGEAQYQRGNYSVIDTSEYPKRYGVVITLGFKIFR